MHHILTTKVQLIVLQVNIDHIGHGGPYKGRDMETVLDWHQNLSWSSFKTKCFKETQVHETDKRMMCNDLSDFLMKSQAANWW